MKSLALYWILLSTICLVSCAPAESLPDLTPTQSSNSISTPSELPPEFVTSQEIKAELVLEGVGLITAMQFAPDSRLFYSEKSGGVFTLDLQPGKPINNTQIIDLEVAQGNESGLLGLALDPNFQENHYFYVYHTIPDAEHNPNGSRIVRYTEQNNRAVEGTPIVDNLPSSSDQLYHFGGGLIIGPDEKLYLIFGDRNMPDAARDPAQLEGSVLRYNLDGTVPEDNPIPGSPVFAYGIRNGFGLTFHPESRLLYETENGTNCDDELNLILPGADYGWGIHTWDTCPYPDDGEKPVYQWQRVVAPAGLIFYTGDLLPQFQGDLLVCAHNESQIFHIRLTANGRAVREIHKIEIPGQNELCRVTLTQGPDGWIYTATGDSILRIGR